jgi:hypothetical protein
MRVDILSTGSDTGDINTASKVHIIQDMIHKTSLLMLNCLLEMHSLIQGFLNMPCPHKIEQPGPEG